MVISTPDLREAKYRGVPVAQAFLRHGAQLRSRGDAGIRRWAPAFLDYERGARW
jgi:hypothetical protein